MQGGAARRPALRRAIPQLRVDRLTAASGRSASTWRCPASAPTSSGGVVDLDRDFGGIGARAHLARRAGHRPSARRHVGADCDRQHEQRQGFVNNNGDAWRPAPRRGRHRQERATATPRPSGRRAPALSLTAGVRTSQVRYDSDDHYVTGPNPDDSGSAHATTTRARSSASCGTRRRPQRLRELRPGLRDADVRGARVPHRWHRAQPRRCIRRRPPRTRSASSALIAGEAAPQRGAVHTPTPSNEIVVDTATGGRTTFKNAGKTRRRGVEADVGRPTCRCGLQRARRATRTCTPSSPTLHDRLAAAAGAGGLAPAGRAAAAGVRRARVDAGRLRRLRYGASRCNTSASSTSTIATPTSAPAYTIGNVRVGFAQTRGRSDVARVRARQQHRRPQLRRDRSSSATPTAASSSPRPAQLVRRRERRCRVLNRRAPRYTRPRSRCTG